jgi:hypothetical protein
VDKNTREEHQPLLDFLDLYGIAGKFGILENTTFRKLDLFPSSGESGGEDNYSVGLLRKS